MPHGVQIYGHRHLCTVAQEFPGRADEAQVVLTSGTHHGGRPGKGQQAKIVQVDLPLAGVGLSGRRGGAIATL